MSLRSIHLGLIAVNFVVSELRMCMPLFLVLLYGILIHINL